MIFYLFRISFFAIGLFFLCASFTSAFAEDDRSKRRQPQAVRKQTPAKVSTITQAAVRAGVLSCAGRIEQVSNFLTTSSQSGAVLFAPPSRPDQRMVSISLEIGNKEVPIAYGSASFAPGMANGCGGMYETVVYWNAKCEEVRTQNFSSLKQSGVIKRNIAILVGGGFTRIFLMPAGGGCVSIKKEVVQ